MASITKKDIGDRLTRLQGELNFKSSRSFALALGLDPSYFGKAQKGEGLAMEHLEIIISKYNINRNWLFFGEGNIKESGQNTPMFYGNENKNLEAQLSEHSFSYKNSTVESLIDLVNRQHTTIDKQQETIHYLTTGKSQGGRDNLSKKVSG